MTADRSGAPLRFATFLAPNMLPVYRFLADQIAHRLGRPVQLVVGSSFDQFDQGEADFGVISDCPMCGWPTAAPRRWRRWPLRCWPGTATPGGPSTTRM